MATRLQYFMSLLVFLCCPAWALDRPEVTFKVFQFPANQIPRIDGKTDDWAIVPADYAIKTDQLWEDSGKHTVVDPQNLEVSVKVGWVKGLNRLYFLYEAYDNYWDFARSDLHNDTFEIVVDADHSGGPLIDHGHPDVWKPEAVGPLLSKLDERISPTDEHWSFHGVQAQNYHIFTPAVEKDWCMAWSSATWIKEFPYSNAATQFNFKAGEAGKLVLEFWITPFDYAGPEGPQRAVESILSENKVIGLSWAIIDYDDVNAKGNNGFWNLSRHHTMYGNASQLCAFRLMPLEAQFQKPIEAQWSFKLLDPDRRLVAFKDLSTGKITSWKWYFGDGASSADPNPFHQYQQPGNWVVILEVEGPEGKSRRSKVWDVQMK
jgi:hypothetical protein